MIRKNDFLTRGRNAWMILRFSALMMVFAACGGPQKKGDFQGDDPRNGTIHISVDESFKPVIDSQIRVYEASNPNTRIIAHYKPEAECMRDLLVDSIRMVIVTRGLTDKETAYYKDTFRFAPVWDRIAFDALAVIVNNEAKDSVFTMDEIRDILQGTSTTHNFQPVFDGLSATSNVRYAIDSVLKGGKLSDKVFGAESSEAVIDYVSKTPNAMGFVGVSWIGNREDAQQVSFLEKVKIASLQSAIDGGFVKPYQANIAKKRYPMIRGLYYIVKENYVGLGRGFASFMAYERGQLVFRRAYLWPGKMNFTIRRANVSE